MTLLMVTEFPFLQTYQVVHIKYTHILSQLQFKTTNLKTSTEVNEASLYKFSLLCQLADSMLDSVD